MTTPSFSHRTASDFNPAATVSRRQVMALGLASLLGPTVAHADLGDLRERGALKIALYKANMPFSDTGSAGMQGLDARLAQALAQQLKLNVQWLPFEAGENQGDDLRNMVWKGHYLGYGPADVMLQVPIDKHLIDDTPQVEFLAPYYRHQLGWLVGADISSADLKRMALDGMTLTAETGTAAASALLGHGGGRFKAAVHLEVNGVDAARSVVKGERQAAYVTRAQAEAAMFGAPTAANMRFEPAALPGTPNNGWVVGMAIKKGQPELSKAIGSAMQTLHDNGTLLALYREQGMQLTAP
jgi:ABC-type amino acid transport substrate-binding protein